MQKKNIKNDFLRYMKLKMIPMHRISSRQVWSFHLSSVVLQRSAADFLEIFWINGMKGYPSSELTAEIYSSNLKKKFNFEPKKIFDNI